MNLGPLSKDPKRDVEFQRWLEGPVPSDFFVAYAREAGTPKGITTEMYVALIVVLTSIGGLGWMLLADVVYRLCVVGLVSFCMIELEKISIRRRSLPRSTGNLGTR